jgi:hypothetical protein
MKRKSGNEEFESNGREKGVENKTQHNTTQHEEDGDQGRKKAALHVRTLQHANTHGYFSC